MRLKVVLPDIIGKHQTGFLKGRYIGENTRLVYDLMDYLLKINEPGLLLLVDFEKAFDMIKWSYIEEVLKAYNIGEDFEKWHKILNNGSNSCVINNGHFSQFFNLERGCRQGDPLSPYIFILSIEPLAQYILKCSKVKGIKVNSYEHKIGQYADDTFGLLDGSKS